MSVRVVQGTLVDMTGTAIQGANVNCTLSTPIAINAADVVVPSEQSSVTNGSGVYSLSLAANADLTPAGTTYSITASLYTQAPIAIVVTNNAYNAARPTYFDIVLDGLIVAYPAALPVQTVVLPPSTVSLAVANLWTQIQTFLGLAVTQSATAVATSSSGTISTAAGISRVSPAGAVSAVVLQAGTTAGQYVTVLNEAIAANSVTFAAAPGGNVADGVSTVIPGLACSTFVWDSITSLWYRTR